jgi:sulfonate transport system ATP-binding protein
MQIDPIERQRVERAAPPFGIDLVVESISKAFGTRTVLAAIDLSIAPGEFVAVVGRSGCGKSTLLRLIAALDRADGGRIVFDGQPQTRFNEDARIMFQDPRLLPWRSVVRNVAIGLDENGIVRSHQVLAQVGLGDRADDWPAVLSGGQWHCVALARALLHEPRLLLLDEPLGALDALTRIEMQELIEGLWQTRGFTAILVTHDVQEAIALADRVVLIEDGGVALDVPIELPRPRSRGSAAFAAIEERILERVLRRGAGGGATIRGLALTETPS